MRTKIEFNSDEIGRIRVLVIENQPWIVANDISRYLYKRTGWYIKQKVDVKEIITEYCKNIDGKLREMNLVSTIGLCRSIFLCKKPNAMILQKYIVSKVLPTVYQYIDSQIEILDHFTTKGLIENIQWIISDEAKGKSKESILSQNNSDDNMLIDLDKLPTVLNVSDYLNHDLTVFLKEQKVLKSTEQPYPTYFRKGFFKSVHWIYQITENASIHLEGNYVTPKGKKFIKHLLVAHTENEMNSLYYEEERLANISRIKECSMHKPGKDEVDSNKAAHGQLQLKISH